MSIRHLLLGGFIIVSSLAASAACWDPEDKGSPSNLMDENRKQCLEEAHFVLPAPKISEIQSSEFREKLINPPSKLKEAIPNGSDVYCRFFYQHQNGASSKFRCILTNSQNQFLDSKGRLVPGAVNIETQDDDLYFIDRAGRKIVKSETDGSSKTIKPVLIKVRYARGDVRNVENYTSAAASRILWALGIPAHSNIMTEKVVCFGCLQDPFAGQKNPMMISNTEYQVQAFPDAAIEVKFSGERLYDPTEHAWAWSDVNSMHTNSPEEQKLEIEIFALATQFLAYAGESSMQNAIVCKKFAKENSALCEQVIAMTHDIGGALGTREKVKHGPAPRGDLNAYMSTPVFHQGTCSFKSSDGGRKLPLDISRKAQLAFLERAKALTTENLKTIVRSSHLGNLRNRSHQIQPAELEKLWVQAIETKLNEIRSAPCR